MSASDLRRRLNWLELPLLVFLFLLFYLITDRKSIGYAAGGIVALGILATAFFRPRWGLLIAMLLLFVTTTFNQIAAIATTAKEHNLTGVPFPLQNSWFLWGAIVVLAVIFLSYLCTGLLRGKKFKPLSGIEWTLLMPLIVMMFYLPISLAYGLDYNDFIIDAIPFILIAGVVVLSRTFEIEGDSRASRYYFLDWFVTINFLILIPLLIYNIDVQPWRHADVGVAAIRYGTGSYDFNFFLVPLLGMILTHDDDLPLWRRRLYQAGFYTSLVRIIVSLFRGAMAGTFLAIVILLFVIEANRRWRWFRMLLIFTVFTLGLGSLVVATVPAARATFNVALVRRVQNVVQGTGDKSIQFRILEFEKVWDEIRRRPILGYGPGQMLAKNFNPKENAHEDLYIHSAYAWFWYKMGILGLALLIVYFSGIYGTCIKLLRRTLHPPDRGWVLGTLAATIAMLPVIQVNNMLYRPQGAFSLMLLLFGLCMIATRYQSVPRDRLPPPEGAGKA